MVTNAFVKALKTLKDAAIFIITDLVKHHKRAAEGLGLALIFFLVTVRVIEGSGTYVELFCAWLCGFIYVRFLSYIVPDDRVELNPIAVDHAMDLPLVSRLAARMNTSAVRTEYALSIVWPLVMVWVFYTIYTGQSTGASDVNDL